MMETPERLPRGEERLSTLGLGLCGQEPPHTYGIQQDIDKEMRSFVKKSRAARWTAQRFYSAIGQLLPPLGWYTSRAAGMISAPRALPSATSTTTSTAWPLKIRALQK